MTRPRTSLMLAVAGPALVVGVPGAARSRDPGRSRSRNSERSLS